MIHITDPTIKAKLFKYVLCTTKKDLEVDDSFQPIDEHLFVHTGQIEDSDRGDYELCIIKAGSRVWAQLMPHGQYYITDREGSNVCHAQCLEQDLIFPTPNNKPKF